MGKTIEYVNDNKINEERSDMMMNNYKECIYNILKVSLKSRGLGLIDVNNVKIKYIIRVKNKDKITEKVECFKCDHIELLSSYVFADTIKSTDKNILDEDMIELYITSDNNIMIAIEENRMLLVLSTRLVNNDNNVYIQLRKLYKTIILFIEDDIKSNNSIMMGQNVIESLLETLKFNRLLGKYRVPENFKDSLMKSYISVLIHDNWFDTLIETIDKPYVIGSVYEEADKSYVMLTNDVKIFINMMNEVVFTVRYKGKLIACEDGKMSDEEREYLNNIYDTIIELVEYRKNTNPKPGNIEMPDYIKIPEAVINNKARLELLNVDYKLQIAEIKPMQQVIYECKEIVNMTLEADAVTNNIKPFKLARRKHHILVVSNLCGYMTKHINNKIDKEDKKINIDTMFLSGILHDLCKFECNDMHDILSAVRSKDILTGYGYPEIGTDVCFIIKEHSNKTKQKKVDLKQQILKEADILSHLALTYFDCISDINERIDDIDKIIDEVSKLKPIFITNIGLKLYKKMMRNLKTYSRDLVEYQLYNK